MERTGTEKIVGGGIIQSIEMIGSVREVMVAVGPCETAAYGVFGDSGWEPVVGQAVEVWAVRYKHRTRRSSTGMGYSTSWIREIRPE